VPPRVGLTPYQAESWKLGNPAAVCELHVVSCEERLVIRLISQHAQELVATSVELNCAEAGRSIPLDAFLEPVRDSSRYFVIRAKDPTGRITSLGIGFRERVHAFDLNAALQDRMKTIQRHLHLGGEESDSGDRAADEARQIAAAEERLARDHVDLSLKSGERIKIQLRAKYSTMDEYDNMTRGLGAPPGGGSDKKKSSSSSKTREAGKKIGVVASSKGGFLLAPPPEDAPEGTSASGAPAAVAGESSEGPHPPGGPSIPAPTNLSPTLSAHVAPPPGGGMAGLQLEAEQARREAESQQEGAVEGEPAAPAADQPNADEEDEDGSFSDFASAAS
jgi:hypothetical protein